MKHTWLVLAVGAVPLLAVASCAASSTSPSRTTGSPAVQTSTPEALASCRRALPRLTVVSGIRTTVYDVRGSEHNALNPKMIDPGMHSHPERFRSAASTDPALWCWTRAARHGFTAWAVHASDPAIEIATYGGDHLGVPLDAPINP